MGHRLLNVKIKRFTKEYNLSHDLATFIVKSQNVNLFESLAKKYLTIKSAFIAETLGPTLIEIKRKYGADITKLTSSHFEKLFEYLFEDIIHKDIIIDVLVDMCNDEFDVKKYASLGTEDIHKAILKIVNENKNAPFPALMGICMKALAGKASGKFISQELKRIVEKGHK